jgi:beta-lactamase class A
MSTAPRFAFFAAVSFLVSTSAFSTTVTLQLPAEDDEFTSAVVQLVHDAQLDEQVPADKNPDKEDETASICVVDLSDPAHERMAGWNADNFIYPASSYKMYVLGEAIRQVCAGERSLDDPTTITENNMRDGSALTAGTTFPLSEVLRLMCQYSDNAAANVAIDVVDRKRATALLHSLGCYGSDVTRKFLPRTLEPEEFTSAPSTVSSARHFAAFLYAAENSKIGGGRGRALIKGYLATNVQNVNRIGAGLPATASLYSKTGEWNIFTAESGIVEDGPVRYIVCIMTPFRQRVAEPRIAKFVQGLHALIKSRASR